MPDLLLELFSEEIPARMQPKAADDLRRLVTDGLVERGLTYAHATAFATPRRLALAVHGLAERSPAVREERKGPRVDAPAPAIEGFLRSTGLARDQLEIRADKKGDVLFAFLDKPGRPAEAIVAETVEAVVRAFPWPKSMRWGDGSLRWVRPLQSILCIVTRDTGTEIVPLEVDGITASDTTRGHRFLAPGAFAVTSFDDYQAKLQRAFVILDPAERAARIAHDAAQLTFAQGLDLVEDPGLLAENAGLTEWPVTHLGHIDPRFLDLPPEVLQTSMRENQKFFSLRDPSGRITAYILVANRDTADHGRTILAGNARVLTARLADAEFFWQNDLRTPLADMAAKLDHVTFHNKLGTQADRIARIAALAREIAPSVGADPALAERAAKLAKADLASQMVYEFPELQGTMGRYYAERAGEDPAVAAAAPEHYAPLGPSDAVPTAPVSVAVALADKVDMLAGFWLVGELPTGSKDPFSLRRCSIGIVRIILSHSIRVKISAVSLLALDNLVTGHRGPRRFEVDKENADEDDDTRRSTQLSKYFFVQDITELAAYDDIDKWLSFEDHYLKLSFDEDVSYDDVLMNESEREFLEVYSERVREIHRYRLKKSVNLPISARLATLKREAPQLFQFLSSISERIVEFTADRLKVHLRDQGIRHDVIDACFQLGGQDDLVLLVARVRALQDFLATEDGANLLTGYRRASNIVEDEQKKDGVEYSLDPDPRFVETPAEGALFAALDTAEAALRPALEAEDFAAAMTALARLREPIDDFFDTTIVNADSPAVRRNRLCLLNRIRSVMNRVAVFSAVEGG